MVKKKLVFISDTHTLHDSVQVPDGDVLFHCGDFTNQGEIRDVVEFNMWLGSLPHPYKYVIAGNHDFLFEQQPGIARSLITNAIYLEDSGVELWGKNIWGSPWQPFFFNWAFNLRTESELRAKWNLIPDNTDILLTHGPPLEILDRNDRGEPCGCSQLLETVKRIQPEIHAFGHIHEGYGDRIKHGTHFINASTCTARYRPTNPPAVIEIEVDE